MKQRKHHSVVYPKGCMLSTSRVTSFILMHIHMVGHYSSLHPLTRRSHVGIHFCCNYNACISVLLPHHTLPSNYCCHLREHIWPCWPSDLGRAYIPRDHTLQLLQFIVCMNTVVFLQEHFLFALLAYMCELWLHMWLRKPVGAHCPLEAHCPVSLGKSGHQSGP